MVNTTLFIKKQLYDLGIPKSKYKENNIGQEVYNTILNVKHSRNKIVHICIIRVKLLNREHTYFGCYVDTGVSVNVINSMLVKNLQYFEHTQDKISNR